MKKLFLLSLIGLFVFSCTENEDDLLINKSATSSKKINQPKLDKTRNLLNNTLLELYGNEISSKNEMPKVRRSEIDSNSLIFNGLSKEEIQIAIDIAFPESKQCPTCDVTQAPTVHGPFQVNAFTEIVRDNEMLLWPGDGTGYPPVGTYVCDVLRYRGTYSTPPGALAGYLDVNATPPNGWGYLTDNNFNSNGRGPVFQSTTNPTTGQIYMSGSTYSVIIIYNILGQTINAHKPFNAYNHGINYKFYYIMP